MTRDLRSVLDEFADAEGRVLARSAPDPRTEARRVRALARRRRAVRVTGAVGGAAAAAVLVGVLAAQGLTSPAPVRPVEQPTQGARTTPAARSTPTPTPTVLVQATPTPTAPSVSPPPAPDVLWPTAVPENEVMYGEGGPWWAVWLEVGGETDAPPPDDEAVQEELRAHGYDLTGTPVACVPGSTAALALPESTQAWGRVLYFATAEDADGFVRAWGRPVAAVVADARLACDWG
ncbi:hypothetical protein AB6N24_10855 [Cellulomonas sp. 179-A 4D5 NHS]|uniref:hypothetical protein n=1 Tax=Cellulomonas sp. 179-A 4D5 NHS TaxID=3142378 RepID=UPI0039A317B2